MKIESRLRDAVLHNESRRPSGEKACERKSLQQRLNDLASKQSTIEEINRSLIEQYRMQTGYEIPSQEKMEEYSERKRVIMEQRRALKRYQRGDYTKEQVTEELKKIGGMKNE